MVCLICTFFSFNFKAHLFILFFYSKCCLLVVFCKNDGLNISEEDCSHPFFFSFASIFSWFIFLFISFFFFSFSFFLFFLFIYFDFENLSFKIGALHPDEQTILVNWYNSLTSKGSLSWTTTSNLCGQSGVTCDTSNPNRVTQLSSFLIELCIFMDLFIDLFSLERS